MYSLYSIGPTYSIEPDKVAMISLPIFAGLLKFISVYINESLAEFVQKWNESVKHKIKIDLRSIKVSW